ncbi:valine--tRNA ligase [Elysia marginata]|uniref:Valine--tRNA ligase n=1 Tax=Elysia marginata TaxID=1093978 RepID=A0AAV4JXV2_9GAST|nr:valine--tRNA ligase [Elysia marginata]
MSAKEDAAASAGDSGQTETETKPKTEKELKKEAARLAKLEKFKAKQEKQQVKQNKGDGDEAKSKKKAPKEKQVIKYEVPTEPGAKKDTKCPMPDAYSPQYVEAAWYDWWVKEGFFKPEYGGRDLKSLKPEEKFVIVIPPPNVTGYLHLGHGLTNSVEDCLVRWHRMKGRAALWVPGCDHAGIATQVVVEKKLWREEKKTRHDLGREAFVQKIWQWKNEKGHRIYDQLRQLGGSYDWDRVAFTMDDKLCRAVTEAFCRMHEKGLIYRSVRLVNWSCSLRSAISDIEVDKKEVEGRTLMSVPGYDQKIEFGVLVSFAYKIIDSEEEIVVATTRIETMLGDTAVAVHPEDERYAHLKGKFVQHPFDVDRKMPIVFDDFVDKEFGTGAVKITPAHDHNDYELGKRHNLPFITIIDNNGLITGNCSQFTGMKRFDARTAVLEALKEKGLYRDTKDNPMVIPTCSRSKDVIEPLLKPQWYVNVKEMADRSVKALREGELRIIPEMFHKTWYAWLENSRWDTDEKNWVTGRTEDEAKQKAAERFGVDASKISLQQDEDVLDTWFSSGLFPFSVFGWPDKVYLHAMVRDAHGRKMSKSLGNIIDPLDVMHGIELKDLNTKLQDYNLDEKEILKAIEGQKADYPNGIPECGVDALRFALISYTAQDEGLRLLHPFMPFVSEELFQRLPWRSPSAPPSICVTPFPENHEAIPRDTELESKVEFVQNVVKKVRSMRSDYQLVPKTKVEVYLKCSDRETAETVGSFQDVVSTMCNTSNLTILEGDGQEPPQGCAMATVSARCETHLMLKGQIDVGKEKVKLQSKKEALEKQVAKLSDAASKPDYETKVPEKVRTENKEKMAELTAQISTITSGIETLLKIE